MNTKLIDYLNDINNRFHKLRSELHSILKGEGTLKDDILIKQGFIIVKYSLNYSKINLKELERLIPELKKIVESEKYLMQRFEEILPFLEEVEKDISLFKINLKLSSLQLYLREALYYSNLTLVRLEQLVKMVEEDFQLHKQNIEAKAPMFFSSFEHVCNETLKFMSAFEQNAERVLKYEEKYFYDHPRTYGRAMSANEFNRTINSKRLVSGKELTPVFDAPSSVVSQLKTMRREEVHDFFAKIGVQMIAKVVIFSTNLKPINHNNPIRQTNGLRAYEFPSEIPIQIEATI